MYQEAGLYTVRASNREGSCSQSWKLEMVEHPKADTQSAQSSAIGNPGEDEDEEIVPDESVVSGDITDPEFLQIMVSQKRRRIFSNIKHDSFREGDWMHINLPTAGIQI